MLFDFPCEKCGEPVNCEIMEYRASHHYEASEGTDEHRTYRVVCSHCKYSHRTRLRKHEDDEKSSSP